MQMVMTSDETQIQISADWPMSHAKRMTKEKSRSAAAIRKLRTDKNCPAEKSWRKGIAVSRENWMRKNFMGYLKCAGGKHWFKKLNREKEDSPPTLPTRQFH